MLFTIWSTFVVYCSAKWCCVSVVFKQRLFFNVLNEYYHATYVKYFWMTLLLYTLYIFWKKSHHASSSFLLFLWPLWRLSQNFWQTVSKVCLKFPNGSLQTWQFHYVVVNQIVNFETKLWISQRFSLGSNEVCCERSSRHSVYKWI